MVSNLDRWIRIFDIPDTSKHKNGFTVYKVISLLYPETCPDAVTKITVWKRFNEFKKLHRDIKSLHGKLHLKGKVPNLANTSLFKRFDEDTIKDRKQSILTFLDYIGSQPQLFTSTDFVKFFQTSHTPIEHPNSNINLIRADLNLPEETEFLTNFNSDDECTISDTDSVTTLSSLTPSIQNLDLSIDHKLPKSNKLDSTISVTSRNSDSGSIGTMDSLFLLDGLVYPTPPQTPSSSTSVEHVQYIVDAYVHINLAIELENNHQYEEAFLAYKTAIDILLKYGKDDTNYERKQLVRYKTDKYLVQAEKIYNMYLADEVKHLKRIEETQDQPSIKRPLCDLYKYKVIKIINNGMLVLHCDTQQLFYVKVIHKTMQFLNDHLILPENVPYMVKLYNHFNCENALFLILEYCSGSLLSEHLKKQLTDQSNTSNKDNDILTQILEISDNESENSYSEVINEYKTSKFKEKQSSQITFQKNAEELTSSDEFVKVDKDFSLKKKPVENIMDKPISDADLEDDLFLKSKKLLSSVNDALINSRNSDSIIQSNFDTDASGASNCFVEENLQTVNEEENKFNFRPHKDVVKWSAQLLLALEKLHVLGITCRDLQIKNLMVTETGDLNLSYMCNVNELQDIYTNRLNINLAPEVYSYQMITAAADWWSYGAILYELLVGMPLSDVHPNGLTSYTHLKIPKYVSAEGRSLLKQLLSYEPTERLGRNVNGIDYLKSHPFFNSVSWDSLKTKFKM